MFAGRATAAGAAVGPAAAGGKGGKFSVEELYGFTKKPKVNRGGNSGKPDRGEGRKEVKEKEESVLASQILEAARRLMERRRLEIYLKECDITMEQSTMPYRQTDGRSPSSPPSPSSSSELQLWDCVGRMP